MQRQCWGVRSSSISISDSASRGRQIARALFIAIAFFAAALSRAQLTTGLVEGTVHNGNAHVASGAAVCIEGGAGFRVTIYSNSAGRFAAWLPYGQYVFRGCGSQPGTDVALSVAPLKIEFVDLIIDRSGGLHISQQEMPSFGMWRDSGRVSTFPEGFSLQSVLMSREPGSVTVPLSFTGLADNRLALVSERAFSWTDTQFKVQGLDATDSYQPGRPVLVPDVEALSEIVMRTDSALRTSESYGNEVGTFLAEPGPRWHGRVSTSATGSAFSSSNLPAASERGAVQQSERFNWLTRDRFEAGGPVTRWADVFASVGGQWASQTIEVAPGQDQASRMLFGNIRGRIRASAHDQLDADYSGSRVDLSNWGVPVGIEALVSRRMSPEFDLPDGFPDEAEADHLAFLQVGWTHHLAPQAGLGVLQVRYGYSTAHFDTWPAAQMTPTQSRVELLGSTVAGAPPLGALATHPRNELAAVWQSALPDTSVVQQQITAGGNWNVSWPRNCFTTPSDINLETANGVAAYVAEYNTPVDSRERVRLFSTYVADHLRFHERFSAEVAVIGDFSRGSLPAQSSPAGTFLVARSYSTAGDLISWNSVAPRAGFAWRIPHVHGFVARGTYLRSYSPLAGRYLDYANPNSLGGSVYGWIDRNGNGWLDPGERGALLMRFGGPYASISPSLRRPHSDEFDVSGQLPLTRGIVASIQLFRRDEKRRIAAVDTGLGANAFKPVSILDPGPDGIPGTFDDQRLTVYQQNPATFGDDRYQLMNPPGLRMLNAGFVAEVRTEWRGLAINAALTAEKAWGPTNPGNAVYENDPGVIGTLFADPNSSNLTLARSFVDRAYLGKVQAMYRLPSAWGGLELASVAEYTDGLPFARQLLMAGLAQGPFLVATTVRGSPEGGNRAQYVLNWNLRVQKAFRMRTGGISASADILNVTNASQQIQQSDLSGPAFNARLPLLVQPARFVRLGFAYKF
jgi:hypothetical protein